MIPAGTVVYEYKDVNELLEQYDGYASVGSPYNHWQGFTNNIVVQLNLVADEFTVN